MLCKIWGLSWQVQVPIPGYAQPSPKYEKSKSESALELPPLPAQHQKNPGVQQEHREVHKIQGQHYHRNVLRVWVIVSGPVGNPESFQLRTRRPKTIIQSPTKVKFLDWSLLRTSLFNIFIGFRYTRYTMNLNVSQSICRISMSSKSPHLGSWRIVSLLGNSSW